MEFGEKLGFLLKNFDIQGRQLAKALHVDPSLVSKWVTGNRIPNSNSPHIDQISNFFTELRAYDFQRDILLERLGLLIDSGNPVPASEIHNALKEWLLSTKAPSTQAYSSAGTFPAQDIRDLLTSVRDYSENPNILQFPDPSSNKWKRPLVGDVNSHEVFLGMEGRRQAASQLINVLMNDMCPDRTLMMLSQGDHEWMTGDPEFVLFWISSLNDMLNRGHSVQIIDKMDRDLSQTVMLARMWMPFLVTCKLETFSLPQHKQDPVGITIYTVPGIAAMLSMATGQDDQGVLTLLFKDPATISLLQAKFEYLLASCNHVITKLPTDDASQVCQQQAVLDSQPGYRYIFKDGLSATTLPISLYERLLPTSGSTPQETDHYLEYQRQRIKAFESNVRFSPVMDICTLEAIDEMVSLTGYMYPAVDSFSPVGLKAEPQDILEHLSYTVELLQRYENYQIALVRRDEIPEIYRMYCSIKEDTAMIVASWNEQVTQPLVLSISETAIVHAFAAYFEELWEGMPPFNRDKQWVIRKLQSRIERLKRGLAAPK
ncbi:MAG: helix-turn-helix domain-containing protein [Acidobacteriota bacterium]